MYKLRALECRDKRKKKFAKWEIKLGLGSHKMKVLNGLEKLNDFCLGSDVPYEFVRIKICRLLYCHSILFAFFNNFILQKSHIERRTERFKFSKNTKLGINTSFCLERQFKTHLHCCKKLSDLVSSKCVLQENIYPFTKNIII
jgi:hypothetical protein